MPDTVLTDPATSQPLRQRRTVRRWLASRLATLIVAAALVLIFERLWPATSPTTNTNGFWSHVAFGAFLLRTFEFHLALGILALAVVTLALRSWRWGAFAACLAITALTPTIRSQFPGGARAAPGQFGSLRLMSVNLLVGGDTQYEVLLSEIARVDPDVICFVEYSPTSDKVLQQSLQAKYPHIVVRPQLGPWGQAVYSKRPFLDAQGQPASNELVNGAPAFEIDEGETFLGPQVRVLVADSAGHTVPVRAVHVTSPSSCDRFAELQHNIARLAAIADADKARWGRIVLAGDFNSTPESALHALLREHGLMESAHALGLGRATTWPRVTSLRFAPGIRLDHVMLAGDGVFVNAGKTVDFGSDHRGVWAEMRFNGDGPQR